MPRRVVQSELEHKGVVPVDSPSPGPEQVLGSLEARVLQVLWAQNQPLSVQDVLEDLNRGQSQRWAYNSAMTVMARLAEKGYLARDREGRAYRYRALVSREHFATWEAGRAAGDLLEEFGDAAVAGFARELKDRPELLDVLRRILDESDRGGPA